MRNGQALVEVIISFALMLVALVGLVTVATKSTSNSGLSQREAQATAYASQAMAWVKSQRSTLSWTEFSAKRGSVYCLPGVDSFDWGTTAVDLANCGLLSGTEYVRGVTVTGVTYYPTPAGTPIDQIVADVEVRLREGERLVRRRLTAVFTPH